MPKGLAATTYHEPRYRPGRTVYNGVQVLDSRLVLSWTIPSHSDPEKCHELTYDPQLDRFEHQAPDYEGRDGCQAMIKHRRAKIGLDDPAPCWHIRTCQHYLHRKKDLLASIQPALEAFYRLEAENRRQESA